MTGSATPRKHWKPRPFDSIQEFKRAYEAGERPHIGFTAHAASRRVEMGITEDEVFQAIARPERITFSTRHQAVNLSAGRLTLAIRLDPSGYPDVLTMLFATREAWERARVTGHVGSGRDVNRDCLLTR
jgi:hypothetical protein